MESTDIKPLRFAIIGVGARSIAFLPYCGATGA